jgi:hypothetical protein
VHVGFCLWDPVTVRIVTFVFTISEGNCIFSVMFQRVTANQKRVTATLSFTLSVAKAYYNNK